MHIQRSPYASALGDRRMQLHPALQEYFATLPDEHVGVGEGIFTRVGTPRRWLWPFLRPLQRRGIVWAGWELNVPFRITNRLIAGRTISAREFLLPHETWTMRDAVALTPHGRLVDSLGEPSLLAASFDIAVEDGALLLTSRGIGMRLGRLRIRIPQLIAPVVRLTERFDDSIGRQRVAVTIDVPLVGRVYEYSGDFTYRVEKESV